MFRRGLRVEKLLRVSHKKNDMNSNTLQCHFVRKQYMNLTPPPNFTIKGFQIKTYKKRQFYFLYYVGWKLRPKCNETEWTVIP